MSGNVLPSRQEAEGPLPALPSCIHGEHRMGKALAVPYPENSATLPAGLQKYFNLSQDYDILPL